MSIIRDSKKDKHNLIAALGTQGNSVFMALHYDICDLLLKWDRFKILFGSQEHIDLLNDTASTLFYNIQRIMLNDIFLHIARLTDSKKTGKNKNLTIRCLPDLLDDDGIKIKIKSKNKIKRLCEEALDKSKNIKKVRNKIIAHTDQETAFKKIAALTVKKYVIQVEEAITSICDPLNKIRLYCKVKSYHLSLVSGIFDTTGGDVGSLIEIIRAGQEKMESQ